MLEKDIEKFLVKRVKALGGKAYKFISPGNVGVPDRIVILPGGRICFVELKRTKGKKLRPNQEYQCEKLQALGVNVRKVGCVKQVQEMLEEVMSI